MDQRATLQDADRELWIAVRRATLQMMRVMERIEQRYGLSTTSVEHNTN